MSDTPAAPGLGDVAHYRPWYRQHVRPNPYFRRAHLIVHGTPVIASCAYAASRLADVKTLEWLAVPVWLLLGSGFVYWFHRHVLHRPTRFFWFAYEKHTLQHHRFYDYEHITRDEPDDLHITLFPFWAASVLAVLSYLTSLALAPLVGENLAHLSMFMMNAYFALYELAHTTSHLPDGHLLTRLPVLRFLREHHRLHHDPALMGRYNFNVVIPLFDWLLGAMVRTRPERRRAE